MTTETPRTETPTPAATADLLKSLMAARAELERLYGMQRELADQIVQVQAAAKTIEFNALRALTDNDLHANAAKLSQQWIITTETIKDGTSVRHTWLVRVAQGYDKVYIEPLAGAFLVKL